MKRWTLSEIKAANTAAGRYFFSPDTMRCFGDTMRSWKVRHQRVLPMRDRDGRNMGGVGQVREFDPATGEIGLPLKEGIPS